MKPSIIILAGGSGSRMCSTTPKVLHKICGKELLFFSIQNALQLSDDIHIVLYHQKELIREYCQRTFAAHIDSQIHFHIQDYQNYPGTGGAILQNQKLLHTKYPYLLILNADMPLITPHSLQQFLHPSPITLGVIRSHNPHGYGRIILQDNKVSAIVEEKDATQQIKEIKTINSGVYLFSREILEQYLPLLNNHNAQKEYYLPDIIKLAAKDGIEISPIIVEETEFGGINTKAQLTQAQEILLAQLRHQAMLKGVTMHLPHSIYLDYDVQFEGECEIEQGVQLLGRTTIKHSHILAHSSIQNSTIVQSSIGPFARIRPDCHITDSHIGNFVEVKNSKLTAVKAGHLSYLGDCVIGEGSNIGAGVITCNYDGKKKHQTNIGKNVFVGSDCQLIAPVTIADHTLIAAGSTVSKDSQSGDLVIARNPQKNIKDGFFAFFKSKKEQQ
ncbi:UDP-N-acetylglucosamine diphosphorylase/glucosamine-1-phosphate N-acetyltransferase [Helicobacter enhydrae]|uniref:Bifunctional protein GlmU n=1 Tax=Helicobacter enhydrae TaxID=222136 RepID=A0A1B1U6N4_9HELI|nr:bifunctional UDP-N-acetylglucosamine diphosphorylase/glucosamine-1-phosphate N-acetyltransferase GlmU [Helicobacter enhydrae]ANV98419.1 UDP-N-acetylglucosamine diphosphorylase/glucosamine-1-phosphate N-acetyltransferase [Helicobacter enhydrae]